MNFEYDCFELITSCKPSCKKYFGVLESTKVFFEIWRMKVVTILSCWSYVLYNKR